MKKSELRFQSCYAYHKHTFNTFAEPHEVKILFTICGPVTQKSLSFHTTFEANPICCDGDLYIEFAKLHLTWRKKH